MVTALLTWLAIGVILTVIIFTYYYDILKPDYNDKDEVLACAAALLLATVLWPDLWAEFQKHRAWECSRHG